MQACGFRSITEPLLQNLDRRKLVLRPGTHFYTGDKRDNMSAYALRIGDYPVCHPASVILWPRLARAFR
jgi:hypothetical protein